MSTEAVGPPLQKPLLEVIICTYNNALLLDRALEALAKQRVPAEVDWGVVVVNNNSTDDTPAVVEKHIRSKRVPQLRLVSEPQQGLTPARRRGVLNTTSDWLAFVDDDCLLHDDWVAQALAFASEHPDCGAFGGKVILDWETPPPAYVHAYGYAFAQQDHGTEAKEVPFLVGAGMVINRAALLASGWVRQQLLDDRVGSKLVSGGDVEIALRIRGAGYPLWYNPACQLRHLIPARRTSKTYLVDINYGLGASQVCGDAMLWPGSYPRWLLAAILGASRATVQTSLGRLKAALKRRRKVEAAIDASFARGRWAGIGRVLTMGRSERRALLGCAGRAALPWKVLNLELAAGLPDLPAQTGIGGIFLIFWWCGVPLGQTVVFASQLPIATSQLTGLATEAITPAVGDQLFDKGFKEALPSPGRKRVRLPADEPPALEALLSLSEPLARLQEKLALESRRYAGEEISVVVCTRDRPEQLKRCLEALLNMPYQPKEIIVVDNAPRTEATRELVARMPEVNYVLEPRPGLSVARNTGISASTGKIIAFTDDDVVVHPDWLARLQAGFRDDQVLAVTGLILPVALDTEAQIIFQGGDAGFGWGYRALTFDQDYFKLMRGHGVPVWRIGAGANMAFRRKAFELLGGFDERLGAGASGCSEDSELWYRVLAEGWLCRYEPTAVVSHYHRDNLESLRQQMYQYLRGHTVALLIQFENYRHWGNLYRALMVIPAYHARRFAKSFLKTLSGLGREEGTLRAETLGWLAGFTYYLRHRRRMRSSQAFSAAAPFSPMMKDRADV